MAPSSSSSPTKVSLKLLIDTKNERVLFAEASKEFIDFLFNLLRLPIGTVTNLLTSKNMVGCIGKLYESVQNLSDDYFLNPNHDRHVLLKPSAPLISDNLLLLPANDHQDGNNGGSETWTYRCGNGCGYTMSLNTPCPNCKNNVYGTSYSGTSFSFGPSVSFGGSYCGTSFSSGPSVSSGGSFCGTSYSSGSSDSFGVAARRSDKSKVTKTKCCAAAGGFVKGVVTYTVMDDLEILPMSTISTITLLSKFNIKDIASLQEKMVKLDMEQGIQLLKASLHSKNVLTSVFLKTGELKEEAIS